MHLHTLPIAPLRPKKIKGDHKLGLWQIARSKMLFEPKSEGSRVMHRHPIFVEDLSRSCI